MLDLIYLNFDCLWCNIELVPIVFEMAQPKFKVLVFKISYHNHFTNVIGIEVSFLVLKVFDFVSNKEFLDYSHC